MMRKQLISKSEFRILSIATVAMLVLAALACGRRKLAAQSGANNSEWPTYGADLASTHYRRSIRLTQELQQTGSCLDIQGDSFGSAAGISAGRDSLMIGGVLYATAGTRRAVVALDAATGELLWMHSENEGERGEKAPRRLSGRGLAYWSDGNDSRVLFRDAGIPVDCARREDGCARSKLWRERRSGPETRRGVRHGQQIDFVKGEIGLQSAPCGEGTKLLSVRPSTKARCR